MVDSVALFDKTKKSVDDSYIVHGFSMMQGMVGFAKVVLEPKATALFIYFTQDLLKPFV